jgi:hypothetical protein
MKDFVLDSTYKDATIVNSNDDIFTIPSGNLPYNAIGHHTVNLDNSKVNHGTNHNRSNKLNTYNLIDYL